MSGIATFEVRYADDSIATVSIEYAGRYGSFAFESAMYRAAADRGVPVTSIMLQRTVSSAEAESTSIPREGSQ